MIKKTIKYIFRKLGFSIVRLPKGLNKEVFIEKSEVQEKYNDCKSEYFIEDEALVEVNKIRPFTMQNDERLTILYQQAVYCEKNGISGDFVECGVWKGGAVGLMALANLNYGKKRRNLRLFDSFQDLCEPDEKKDGSRLINEAKLWGGSKAKVSGNLKPVIGFYDTMGGYGTLEGNKRLIENTIGYDSNYIHYHVGWFQETLPKAVSEISEIAILRLDGDLYESIKVCLDYLYPKVVSGGFIIIDDYLYYKGCTDAVDEFLKRNNIRAYLHHADYASKYHTYWIKP